MSNTDLGLRGDALLAYILDNIEAGNLKHDQGQWATAPKTADNQPDLCQTAHCVAGWAAVLSGATPILRYSYFDKQFHGNYCTTPDGEKVLISQYARQVLRLVGADEDELFGFENSFADLRRMQQLLKAGEPLAWD